MSITSTNTLADTLNRQIKCRETQVFQLTTLLTVSTSSASSQLSRLLSQSPPSHPLPISSFTALPRPANPWSFSISFKRQLYLPRSSDPQNVSPQDSYWSEHFRRQKKAWWRKVKRKRHLGKSMDVVRISPLLSRNCRLY